MPQYFQILRLILRALESAQIVFSLEGVVFGSCRQPLKKAPGLRKPSAQIWLSETMEQDATGLNELSEESKVKHAITEFKSNSQQEMQ
ncbi:hypothetical protein EGR_03940 [Echinococcus granulosus]|uniref:Uncharacterized protein n=1 Tax=Echinococcus granulosus TaxID=6210 RepID=W6UIH0_ECHGR|nr:hypothetical protein EGR_03940 [Echinococcus granulosus]EUB61265.1 hypothetical protein EGR_03940 [Echinococcus granulosus]